MLLTIYNLPNQTRYSDIKALIHTKCGIKDVILDNLTSGGNNTKKVTVGLAEEEDAAILARKLNGLFLDGLQLCVEPLKKKQPAAQEASIYNQYVMPVMAARAEKVMPNMAAECQPNLQQPYYQQSYQQNYQYGYTDSTREPMMAALMSGMQGAQNTLANYGYPQQMQYQSTSYMVSQPLGNFAQSAPLGFNDQTNDSSWSDQNNWNTAQQGNENSQRNTSRWDDPGDRDNRSNLDASSRDKRRDRPARDSGREPPSRELGRDRPRNSGRRDSPRRHERDARDRGRDELSRDRRRGGHSPSRDRRRDAPSDRRRDAPARDRGRNNSHHRGDVPSRDRARNSSPRDRNYSRDEPEPQQPMDLPYGRDTFDRNQTYADRYMNADPYAMDAKPFLLEAPPPPMISQQNIFGDHVVNPSVQAGTFSQQRNGPKPKQPQPAFKNQKKQSKYEPPNKRPRPGIGAANFAGGPPAKMARPESELRPLQTKTWRAQVAAAVAKEIVQMKGIKIDLGLDILLPELKRAVRARLENMFGENYAIKMPLMMVKYRARYPATTDMAFYKQVTAQIKENLAKEALEPKEEGAEEKPAFPAEVQEKLMQAVKKPQPPLKKIEPQPAPSKIPSYPLGDKKLSQLNKDKCKNVFIDAESLYSRLEKNQRQAMDEVIVDLCHEIHEDLKSIEPEAEYKMCHERACDDLIGEVDKMIKIFMAKRLLNEGPILVRVFCQPKMISRGRLAPILASHGVTSLRKSEGKKPLPMFIGGCDNYDVLDKLITMPPLVVDDSTVTFKPFQLCGKQNKMTIKQIQEQNKKRRQMFEEYTQGQGNTGNDQDVPVKEENDNPETQNDNPETQENCNETQPNNENIKNEDQSETKDNIEEGNENNATEQENNVNEGTVENKPETDYKDVNQSNFEDYGWTTEKVENAWADFEETGNTENLTTDPDETGNFDEEAPNEHENIDDIDIADVNDDDLEDW